MTLTERSAELSVLRDAFQYGTGTSTGTVVAIEGPVGSGKTRLLRAFAADAADAAALVLSAACSRLEQDMPLAAVHQLLQDREPHAAAEPAVRALVERAMSAVGTEAEGALVNAACRETLAFFQRLTERCPVVVCVDDAHHMDAASAHCLLFALRRLRPPQFIMLLARSDGPAAESALTHGELLSQAGYRSVRTRPLSPAGVRELVGARLDGTVDVDAFAAACHRITGGSPRLVEAILDDNPVGDLLARPDRDDPVLGESFDRAVLSCLYRGSEQVAKLAQGIAVLGAARASVLPARLVEMEPNAVQAGIAELTGMGLLDRGGFRDGRVRRSVLASMAPQARADLHWRAAELLHDAGESTRTVAGHVIAANRAGAPWAIDVLHAAARLATSEHDADTARTCLELAAWTAVEDDREGGRRAETHAMLLDVMWRVDPDGAEQYVASLTAAMAHGGLEASHTVTLIRHLLWCGRISEAAEALTSLAPAMDDPAVASSPFVRILQLWLLHSFPVLARLLPPPGGGSGCPGTLLNGIDVRMRSAEALAEVLANGAGRHVLLHTRQVLQSQLCSELSFESVYSALLTLLYSEQFAEAAQWCDSHLAVAAQRDGSPCHAMLLGLRAEIHLRTGDLVAAERAARRVTALFAERRWGAVSELPLGCLLQAQIALGKLDEAAELVERRVPLGFLQSRSGLGYRYAVGRFRLATGDPQAALDDFVDCGDLARAWSLDAPTLVPWRAGAAEALLRLGRPERARELLQEQLALVGDRYPRVRGMTLRLLARAADVQERRALLTEAEELLRASGARFELAGTLMDLGAVHSSIGAARRARVETRLAQEIARDCGVAALAPRPDAAPAGSDAGVESLTHAERQVASLAARGYTNREIAAELFVTSSTVEQHLTKVFRKLKVRQREELPVSLGLRGTGRPARR
ncbi:AAA family ATPase [Actinomadura rayongensis]|uniref:AAA family ATPase n=1 Tax=Actinomadura rayongensis TaxID=1429076 RepID=A0A6I4VYS8_9ACTN|nr:LuxR family transcriptional regulator [Actinomadura rayongensis]MXQ63509.1 AAA family ATPase [Actinomadura rayongensis]